MKTVLQILFVLSTFKLCCQDIILCIGDTIKGKIVKAGNDFVEYRRTEADSGIYQVLTSNVVAIKYKDGTFYSNPSMSASQGIRFGFLKPIGDQNTSALLAESNFNPSIKKAQLSPSLNSRAAADSGIASSYNFRRPLLDPNHMRISSDEFTMRFVGNPTVNFYLDEAHGYRKKRAIGYLAIPTGIAGVLTTLISVVAESAGGAIAGVALVGVAAVSIGISSENRTKELSARKKAIELYNQIPN